MSGQDERRELVAHWLSYEFDDTMTIATDGTILIEDGWRRKADELLALLDGVR